MADRRVKESNDRDPGEEQNQMRIIQAHRSVLEKQPGLYKDPHLGFGEQNDTLTG
jgi:hypothetical protein